MSAYKFPAIFRFSPSAFSFPPTFCLFHSLPMAQTTGDSHLWKQTPATNMTKAQLLELANAKDARVLHLRRKNSTYCTHTVTANPAD